MGRGSSHMQTLPFKVSDTLMSLALLTFVNLVVFYVFLDVLNYKLHLSRPICVQLWLWSGIPVPLCESNEPSQKWLDRKSSYFIYEYLHWELKPFCVASLDTLLRYSDVGNKELSFGFEVTLEEMSIQYWELICIYFNVWNINDDFFRPSRHNLKALYSQY